MAQPLKILLIDDDPWFIKIFEKRFQKRFPEHKLDTRQAPEVVEGYDVYVIDNDFKGTAQLPRLAGQLAAFQPKPTVFALSGTLDNAKRQSFQQLGCKAAFEKANPDDLERLFAGIEQCQPLSQATSHQVAALQAKPAEPFRVLLIDDDIDIHKMFGAQFRHRFPKLKLDTSLEPQVGGAYDVFVIDNQFTEGKMAESLAQSIRKEHPEAVIIAHSATLDVRTLKSLLNKGCSGACEKGNPEDLEVLFKLIEKCAEEKAKRSGAPTVEIGSKGGSAPPSPVFPPSAGPAVLPSQEKPGVKDKPSTQQGSGTHGKGILAALRTAADLLREWNARLDQK